MNFELKCIHDNKILDESLVKRPSLFNMYSKSKSLMLRLLARFRNENPESESFPRLLAKIMSGIIFIFMDPTTIWESNMRVLFPRGA